jgi:cholesterol oxidase
LTGQFELCPTDPSVCETVVKLGGTTLAMHAAIEIDDLDRFVADPTHSGAITGSIDFAPIGMNMAADRGVFRLFSPTDQAGLTRMVYALAFTQGPDAYYVAGHKDVRNDRHGVDLWNDTTTLFTRLHRGPSEVGPVIGAGILRLGVPDLLRLTSTIRALNAGGHADELRAVATFGRFFMGSLWDTYGPR